MHITLIHVAIFSILGLIVLITAQYKISFFANSLGQMIGDKILSKYLSTVQNENVGLNSSNILNSIIVEGNRVSLKIIQPILDIFSRSMLIIGFLSFSILINPKLTISLIGVIFLIYILFILGSFRSLKRMSKDFTRENKKRINFIQEAVASSTEIKLYSKQSNLINLFSKSGAFIAKTLSKIHIISISPKLVIEYGAISCIAILYALNSETFINLISQDTAVLISFARIMPVAHQLYNSISVLRGNYSSLHTLTDLIESLNNRIVNKTPITDWNSISFKNIIKRFSIIDEETNASKDIELNPWSIEINKKGLYGIFGASGSGKSTAVGIICGLIKPEEGRIEINNNPIELFANKYWLDQVAFVQQTPVLMNTSIEENIVFSKIENSINYEKLNICLNQSGINLAKENLSLSQNVGERGNLLSGGQRQRIALARALYSERQIIIMDEPTSALDKEVEQKMIETINELSKTFCIIVISHSLKLKDGLKFAHILELEQ